MFIEILDYVTKDPKIGNAVDGSYQVLPSGQYTVVIQRKELAERIAVDRVALGPSQAVVLLIFPELASAMDIYEKI